MRYIIDKKGVDLLKLKTLPAVETLASDITITNEALAYKNFPVASVELTDAQVALLKSKNISCTQEIVGKGEGIGGLLILDNQYEKTRTGYTQLKNQRNNSAALIKVAFLDTGRRPELAYEFGYNFIDNNTNVAESLYHGTATSSVVKGIIPATGYEIGLANDCELHILKIIGANGAINESALIAAYDYCVTHQIDFANCSLAAYINNHQTYLNALKAANCVLVCASGNSLYPGGGDSSVVQPAALNYAIAVNAQREDLSIKFNSVFGGHGIDFAASGDEQEAIHPINLGVYYPGGTSLSAPFITGSLAVLACKLRKIDPVLWADNYKVVEYAKQHAILRGDRKYFGFGNFNHL